MKFFIKAKTKCRENKIEKINDNYFNVFVKEPPVKGKANEAIIALLAKYFNVPKASIEIVSGRASKQKLIKISD